MPSPLSLAHSPFVSCKFRHIFELVSCSRLICSRSVPRIRPFWSPIDGPVPLLLDRLLCLVCWFSDSDPETPVPEDPELDDSLLWLLSTPPIPPGDRFELLLDLLLLFTPPTLRLPPPPVAVVRLLSTPPPPMLTFSLSDPPGSLLNLEMER